MAYRVLLHPKALKALRSMIAKDAARVRRALRALEEDPYTPRSGADIRKLRGTAGRQDLFRLRVGRYRAVYAIIGRDVLVTDLFPRGAEYEL